jgi:hypothetical protein
MPMLFSVHESIHIAAPIERCFALSTRIELVQRTLGMVPIEGGLREGHIAANSRVVWRGWKFGLPARLLLEPHIRKLARQRFCMIKELAEGEGWRQFAAEPEHPQP